MLLVRTAPSHRRVLAWLLAVSIVGCAPPPPPIATPPLGATAASPSTSPPSASGYTGLDRLGMDTSVAPGQDFFAYANGGWVGATSIPADVSSYGPIAVLSELSQKRTADLIREIAAGTPAAGSEQRKIADYYASFADETTIEAKGLTPLAPRLDAIRGIASRVELSKFLGGTLRADVDVMNLGNFHTDALLGLWVAQDMNEPSRYAPFFVQGGLALPDRDYYLSTSPQMEAIRTTYRTHIAAVFTLLKMPDEQARARRVFELEKKIAEVHLSLEDSEAAEKGNNHVTRRELEASAPGLEWSAFLGAAGLDKQPSFVVWQPSAVRGIAALVAREPLEVWRDYLAFHAADHMAAFLPKAFVEEDFLFYGKSLRGTPVLRDRWKRAVDATNDALGDAVGKIFAERYFPAAEKARVEEMVRNIVAAFAKRIDALPWMATATKARAKAKLAVLKVGVGYPDKWRDYTTLEVVRGDAFGNAERAELFDYKRNLAKLGQSVDRSEWVMTPQTVDAVNLPVMNALNFPAAILQAPNLDPKRPLAMDYGAAGAVIGHEICHSFDSQGALFDEAGRLRSWWTPDDFAHFKNAADALAKQFDAYKPFPDVAVNGKQTLSENMADVAGVAAAYDAYRAAFGGKAAPPVAGFTGDQQFFIAFAQFWRSKTRDAALRQRLVTDGHAPPEYRADTVRNLDAWYDAFDVKPGQALFLAPEARARIW